MTDRNMTLTETASLSAADTCRAVADIIDFEPESFDMQSWDCGTTACIAGHIGRLHGDIYLYSPIAANNSDERGDEWQTRQAERINLLDRDSRYLFAIGEESNRTLSDMLRQMSKELDDTQGKIVFDSSDLTRIHQEVIKKKGQKYG